VSKCEHVLIRTHLVPLQEEFQNLLNKDKIDDLTRMYGLLSRIPDGLESLRSVFEAHVKKQGLLSVEKVWILGLILLRSQKQLVHKRKSQKKIKRMAVVCSLLTILDSKKKQSKTGKSEAIDPKVYVDALLEVHKKFAAMVEAGFRGEAGFVASLDKACREFVNRNSVCKTGASKSPELLAKFCDALLRKSSKVTEEGEVEDVLNSIVSTRYCLFVLDDCV
jgi:cullin 1